LSGIALQHPAVMERWIGFMVRSAIFSIVVFGFCLIKTCGKKKNQFLCGHLCFPSVACGAGLACCWGFAPIGEQLFECWFWIFSDWV